ncbi:MAG: type VII secretion target [Propionibacteriaceae bacterium]|nr:type VII secretion target [Propionibacteriaceae bacterium]
MTGFEVSPEGLRSHASHLGEVSDAVALASDACGQASITDGSLGMMIGPLVVSPLWVAESAAGLTVSSAGDAVDRLATEVQQAAGDFETTDEGIGQDYSSTRDPVLASPTGSSPNVNPRISKNIALRMG